MTQADSVLSTPPTNTPIDTTRRRFLSQAAGVAASGTALALATIPPVPAASTPASPLDPVYGLIETHRSAREVWEVALEEKNRLDLIGDPSGEDLDEVPCHAAMDAFNDLVETAPTTFAGLVAWAMYLEEVRKVDAWIFQEEGAALVVTLAEALRNLAVVS
jgi:hypothetical protein